MIPYESPVYFVLLGIALVPLIIAQTFGKKVMIYQSLFTVSFLWISFGGKNLKSGAALLGFGVWQLFLIKGYEWYRQKKKLDATWVFITVLLLSLVPLFCVKVWPVFWGHSSILGFLGISYVTFKTVNIIMELRDNLIKKVPVGDFFYFLYFFPTISSGPIDRFRRFQKELHEPVKKDYLRFLEKGIFYIFLGFLYKFLIAQFLDFDSIFLGFVRYEAVRGSFFYLVVYMYLYSMYLFFDFAGYSFFAVGVSYIMGYETPKNFHLPFLSKNIKDFWNRWHMSLSFWFRDFVYMRLVYWLVKKKLIKSSVKISNLSYFALFLLMGLWHGFTWYFVAYGLFHALLMCATDAWIRFKKKHKGLIPENKLMDCLNIFLTMHAVFFGLLIFSGIFDDILK
ncbi:MAG: D-alanyl-lipoteichoic acid biosynthesis protein DltB [Lactobacillales bacterium]|jgi:membrane protein involved in D-alanine export|nr:D-alanyl-lipoteichoic acid biosynthesis protein DltB [Lactobacillales bacterium]